MRWISGAAVVTAIAMGGFATSAGAQEAKARSKAKAGSAAAEQAFVTQAAQGGQAEVQLGKLASEHGTHPDVKQFGDRLVRDHGQANQELAALAAQKGWTAPDKPAKKHQADEQRLSRLTGDAFDRAYMQHMVKDHEMDVRAFEQAARQVDDAELKAWIEKALPTLREHLDRARAIAASVSEAKRSSQPQR